MGKLRKAGILLHPTSLPSPYGIGDLGKESYLFLEFLKNCNLNIWQILPIGPVGYGNSPYQSYSAFAGNPLLINIELLIEEGLLPDSILIDYPSQLDSNKIDFARVNMLKGELFRKAFSRFNELPKPDDYFVFLEENKLWLNNYALFMSAKNYFNGSAWNQWDKTLALREHQGIGYYSNLLKEEINYHFFLQYKFFQQWKQLKNHANLLGIKIIGDLPIFVSYDSSDVWSNPQLFDLNNEGNPNHVAGVPPDYFSKNGQYWGNPLYRWPVMAQDDYFWWQERFRSLLKLVDLIRIDHFRGFEAYWQIPATEDTAVNGKWIKGPGANFFSTIEKHLGPLPVIAEDLGFITPDVHRLRNRFNYPGMQVLQFAFEDGKEAIEKALGTYNMAVYTGTHDNDTTLGWYRNCLREKPKAIKNLSQYCSINFKEDDSHISWELIELAFKSKGKYVIIPFQDVLSLDSTARMNFPGTVGDDNWSWRFKKEQINDIIITRLKILSQKYIQ
ncbi:4-alpha-glucanotransferase [Desulfitibacter alkalitolerans]|uniref:4-alpha-glucanotransferase n=1 Tax=Desulfitibacter alkalitolerans TaxID=264641 RepID=UPI000482AAF0|nr:4-alpha-glucanotransferase [Desulfitibacter alkalitolerans]